MEKNFQKFRFLLVEASNPLPQQLLVITQRNMSQVSDAGTERTYFLNWYKLGIVHTKNNNIFLSGIHSPVWFAEETQKPQYGPAGELEEAAYATLTHTKEMRWQNCSSSLPWYWNFYLLHVSTSHLEKDNKLFTGFVASRLICHADIMRGVTLFPWQSTINIQRYIILKKICIASLLQQVPSIAAFPGALPSYFLISNWSN